MMNIAGGVSSSLDTPGIRPMEAKERPLTTQVEQSKSSQESENNPKEEKVDLESLQSLLGGVNDKLEPYDTQVQFSVHEKTKQVMIKVVNTATNETVREIPSEKLMDIMANLLEVAGILVDVKA
ncbi:flagellar protein FlaG [Andreesenia angusta]|nr:flagellar protein FlaG [Andreesenia angusta]